jgi:alkanesulfonate monooxygenase SsuD/methylene tetrahydromethanopterin reductase-like flavin-dependent oxidoreductase (luciferase family)
VTADLHVDAFLVGAHGPQATLKYAVAAERAGLDGVWLAEHHFTAGPEQTADQLAAAAEQVAYHRRAAVGAADRTPDA